MTQDTTITDELKACPFCGDRDEFNPSLSRLSKFAEPGDADAGTTANLEAGYVDSDFYVECDKCAACGPPHATEAEAITAWNTRPKETPTEQDNPDEAYEIGKRDGYEQAVQDIDLATGGDGEYRYCLGDETSERHCPDAATMKQRIIDRCARSTEQGEVARRAYLLATATCDRCWGGEHAWETASPSQFDALLKLARKRDLSHPVSTNMRVAEALKAARRYIAADYGCGVVQGQDTAIALLDIIDNALSTITASSEGGGE